MGHITDPPPPLPKGGELKGTPIRPISHIRLISPIRTKATPPPLMRGTEGGFSGGLRGD